VLRETVDEAAKLKMPVIAYCVVQQGGHFLTDHPEFRMLDADGNPIARFCYNSGYLESMKKLLAEQLAYGIDGFHIDMLDQGFGPPYGCWCNHCQQKFRKRYQQDMPEGPTWDADWDHMLDFRYRSSREFELALTRHVKQLAPQATVDFNYHGNPPFSWEVGQRPIQHAQNADFVTGETGVWGFSALTVGLNAQFYKSAFPDHPYQVAIQRGVRMYHDQTTRPLNDIRWELFTLLAHGAFVTMVDKTAHDGWLDPVAYERIGAAFAEARKKREHFGQPLYQEIGLYFSARTRDWLGRETPQKYFSPFQGWHKACVLEHIPFGILFDENITLERLQAFPIVCLANAAIVSPEEMELLRQFVTRGGQLIITGHAGQLDDLGEPKDRSTLEELIGARFTRRVEEVDNWFEFPADTIGKDFEPLFAGLKLDWPFLVEGPATAYVPTTASSVGVIYAGHRTPRQLRGDDGLPWPMSAGEKLGPAILINRLGNGRVVTFAGSPGQAVAGEHHIVEVRRLMRNVIRWLNPEPLLYIEAPSNVEIVISDDTANRRIRVHCLGYNPTPQTTPPTNRPYVLPGLIEDSPIFRIAIRTKRTLKTIHATNNETRITREGSRILATVPDVHEVLVLEY
jgi:hypothetical protein